MKEIEIDIGMVVVLIAVTALLSGIAGFELGVMEAMTSTKERLPAQNQKLQTCIGVITGEVR